MINNSLTHTAGRFSSVARLALAHKAAGSVDTYVPQLRAALLLYNALVYICRKERGPQTLLPPSVCTRYRAPEIVHTTVTYTLTHTPLTPFSPTQLCPFRAITYPVGQEQVKEPGVFLQRTSPWQACRPVTAAREHSSISAFNKTCIF